MIQIDTSLLIQYSLGVPLVAALLAAVIPYRNFRDAVVISISTLLPFFVYNIYKTFIAGGTVIEWKLFEIVPNIYMHFKIEALGVIFAAVLAVLWVISLIYSVGYIRSNNEGNECRFSAFLCLAIFASLGLASAGNLLTMFIFYEAITLATYPLITHHRNDNSKKAGRLYLAILIGTSVLFFLPAIILTLNTAGTIDFISGGILTDTVAMPITMSLLLLYILGISKIALMPLHEWLPAAMVAPTPVSALLHAVAVVNAGAFSIIKIIVYIFGVSNLNKIAFELQEYGEWLLYLSGFTLLMASIIALTRDNLKQRLAYSTISQLAYIILACSLFSAKGITAAIFQLVLHSFAKLAMFFAVGSVYTISHKKKVSEISGIGRHMPFTMAAFALASISIIGLPPAAGFFAKWYLLDGAIADERFAIIIVIIISTMLNAAYFLPIIYKAFFGKEKTVTGIDISRKLQEAPIAMVATTCLAAMVLLALFIWPMPLFELAEMVK